MDLYFNNSIFFIAFVVVAAVVLISLVILARDLIMMFFKRFNKKADLDLGRKRRDTIDGEDNP